MLSWNDHISYVCQSLMKYFGIFNHIKAFLSKILVRQLYFAFIYSRISYGIECFGNSCNKQTQRLQIIQNKLLKLALKRDPRTSTNSLHGELHILKVCDISTVKILLLVNNILLGICPDHLNNYFQLRETNYDLRFNKLTVVRTRTKLASLGIYVRGANLWNNFSENLKKYRYQKNFKKYIIKHFIDNYTTGNDQ